MSDDTGIPPLPPPPFDPEKDDAWQAMIKLAGVDQMKRTADVIDLWFNLVARDTSAGSSDRALLRERAITSKVVGSTAVLDEGLALADYRLQAPQLFTDLETYLDPVTRPTGEPTDQLSVLKKLLPAARILLTLRQKRGASKAEKDLAAGLRHWLERLLKYPPRSAADIPKELRHVNEVIKEAIDFAEGESFTPKATDPAAVEARLAELRDQAAEVLATDDPVTPVDQAFRTLGYGGNTDPAMIVYLGMTSRLLAMRRGSMPCHLLLIGVPGTGKSYTTQVNLVLLPQDSWHAVDAGSPRVLIYDPAPLQHRVLVFSEADSLPSGEDNPAASAVRGLLQDHHLHYDVVVRDKESGEYTIQTIQKPGPTAMVTTAIKRLGPQLDSRLFVLEVPEDRKRIKEALLMRATIEQRGGVGAPDDALVAFQAYLQWLAPWDVVVPFAEAIARAVGESSAGPRILRDFERLLALIKSVAILRHQHRQRGDDGRWIATLEDYRLVYQLVGPMYEGTTGASKEVRQVVEAVVELIAEKRAVLERTRPGSTISSPFIEERLGVTGAEVARRLEIYKMAASRRIHVALDAGWLVNQGAGKRQVLVPGEPLPEVDGLPNPESLARPRRTPVCLPVNPVTTLPGSNGSPNGHPVTDGHESGVTSKPQPTQQEIPK